MARLVELRFPHYVPLIHDLIKNAAILLVVEVLQKITVNDPVLDKVFLTMLSFTLIGNLVYYLIVDPLLIGAGPILSGPPSAPVDDKQG